MTTPTVTEAEQIGRGWYTYRRVIRAREWPAGNGQERIAAIQGLALALETYADLLHDMAHPAAVLEAMGYAEEAYGDDALDKALSRSAQAAGEWAAELDRLVPEHGSEEAA